MVFWDDWQLYLKLIFVLGIAIVLTVIAGVLKLMYDQHKLKQFTKIEKEKNESQSMVEEFARQRRGRQETPFGIRAIESGIEVEGVWISRNNSPASSAPGSPLMSPQAKGKAASRSSEIPAIQIPDQSHPYSDRSRSPNGSVGSFERATSAERLESVSGASDHTPMTRSTYKPRLPSALRYSTADDLEAGHHLPSRSGSGSSQESSEGSRPVPQHQYPSGYQQVREPTYYRPTGMGNYNSGPSIPPQALTSPEHVVAPGRSNRSSYAAQTYSPRVAEQNQPPTPQRFYNTNESPVSARDSFANPMSPSTRSYADTRTPQGPPMLEAIELTDNPTMGNIPAEKTKKIPRKLQKKTT